MKKTKIWLALVVLAIIVTVSASCEKDEEVVLDFDITVPADWSYYVLANQGMVYMASRNPRDLSDTLLEYLNVYKEYLPDFYFETYWTSFKTKLIGYDSFKSIITEKDTAINGTTGHRIIYREEIYSALDTFDVITTRYLFYVNDNGYNLGMVAIDTIYPDVKPVFDEIISTFQFKESL